MVGEYSFDQGQDVPMCISAHPQDSILCAGVNETDERIEKGLNQSCRIFKLESQKTGITLEQVDKVKVFDSNNSQHYQKLCAFSSDGKFLATASSDGQVIQINHIKSNSWDFIVIRITQQHFPLNS